MGSLAGDFPDRSNRRIGASGGSDFGTAVARGPAFQVCKAQITRSPRIGEAASARVVFRECAYDAYILDGFARRGGERRVRFVGHKGVNGGHFNLV